MVGHHSPSKEQITYLFLIVNKYIKDESKWVKLAIYKEFGKFIYELSMFDQTSFGKMIDKMIVTYLEETENKSFEENDLLNQHVAFNMPSVVLVSNPKLWKFISESYFKLCDSPQIQTRISLAASFHEVFKSLNGCQLASKFEKQMIETFVKFTKDIDEVK